MISTAASYVVFGNATSFSSVTATGSATLGGTAVVNFNPGMRAGTYRIFHANGGLGGTMFTALATVAMPSMVRNARLTYDFDDVFLTVDPGTISPSLAANASANQKGVAGGIDNAILGGANPTGGFNTLLGLTGAALGNALNQVNGQSSSANTQSAFDASNSFMGAMFDPFNPNRLGSAGGGASEFRGGTG